VLYLGKIKKEKSSE